MKRAVQLLVVALCVVCVAATVAVAGKPPGGGDTGGGTVYYEAADPAGSGLGSLWSMNSDGSGKTPLPLVLGPPAFEAEPSRLLHNSRRWFLAIQDAGGTYPDGITHRDLFAVGEDGLGVPLTLTPDLEEDGSLKWAPGDTGVSFRGRRWDPALGTAVEAGIYFMPVAFDDQGIPFPLGQPALLVQIERPDSSGYGVTTATYTHDWSPDGTKVAYDVWSPEQSQMILVCDLATGISSLLVSFPANAWGGSPAWSPDGVTLAFSLNNSIETINVNDPQATRKQILPAAVWTWYATPTWSPTGSHIAYDLTKITQKTPHNYVGRTTADGRGSTSLTRDLDWALSIGWR